MITILTMVFHQSQKIFKALPTDNLRATIASAMEASTITISTKLKTSKLLVIEAAAVVPVASTKMLTTRFKQKKKMGKQKKPIPPPSLLLLHHRLHQFPMGDIYHIETEKTIL